MSRNLGNIKKKNLLISSKFEYHMAYRGLGFPLQTLDPSFRPILFFKGHGKSPVECSAGAGLSMRRGSFCCTYSRPEKNNRARTFYCIIVYNFWWAFCKKKRVSFTTPDHLSSGNWITYPLINILWKSRNWGWISTWLPPRFLVENVCNKTINCSQNDWNRCPSTI